MKPSNKWFFTGTYNDVDFNNHYYGVATTFQIPTNWGGGNAEDKSAWCAINGNPYVNAAGVYIKPWCQIGAAMNKATGLTLVFHTYHLGVGEVDLPKRLVTPGFKLVAGQVVRFEFVNIRGTTWWQVKCNDTVVYEVDFGCEYGVKIELMTEQYAPKIAPMPDIIFYPALQYEDYDGYWQHLPTMMSRQAAWSITGLGENKVEMKSGTGEWYIKLW